jgi:hypothetical protein
MSASAGRSRRARLAQKAGSEILPVRSDSAIRREVIRKPEITKKIRLRKPDQTGELR